MHSSQSVCNVRSAVLHAWLISLQGQKRCFQTVYRFFQAAYYDGPIEMIERTNVNGTDSAIDQYVARFVTPTTVALWNNMEIHQKWLSTRQRLQARLEKRR